MIVITWSHLSILDISALVTISKNVHDPHKTVTCVLFTKKKKKNMTCWAMITSTQTKIQFRKWLSIFASWLVRSKKRAAITWPVSAGTVWGKITIFNCATAIAQRKPHDSSGPKVKGLTLSHSVCMLSCQPLTRGLWKNITMWSSCGIMDQFAFCCPAS